MSRYGNLAAGPDKVVTPEDLRCWRDLISEAKKAAASPPMADQAVPTFVRVAKAAKNACAPGVVTKDNAFVRLSRLANRYAGETAGGRRAMQEDLGAAATAAEMVLEPGEGREPRERKDIDG